MSGPARSRVVSPITMMIIVIAAAGFALALLGAHADPVPYRAAPARPAPSSSVAPATSAPAQAEPEEPPSDRAGQEVGGLALSLVVTIAAVALLVLLALVLQAVRVRRSRGDPGGDDASPGRDARLDLATARFVESAQAGLDELTAELPVADAIIACWQRLRAAAAEVGLPPDPSDTPTEAVLRVLGFLRGAPASAGIATALHSLAALYREARFSRHEMRRGDVWVAREALGAILTELDPEGHARASPGRGRDEAGEVPRHGP